VARAVVLVSGVAFVVFGVGWLPFPRSAPPAEVNDGAAGRALGGTGSAQSPADGRRTLTVLGAGDVLVHPPVWQQARRDSTSSGFDFFPMFKNVSQTISGADLAICHMETPLARSDGPFEGFPTFNAPPQVLQGVKRAGFDACSTASNHSIDQGEAGVERTIDAFDAAGLGHTGTFQSADQASIPTIYQVHGVKVAHLAYSLHFDGRQRPPGKEWLANLIEPGQIIAMARRAREAGAEIVLLSLHWGTEYLHQPDFKQQALGRNLISSPHIDAILGHHAHVVQPIEQIGGKWVVYGMGNELARHARPIDDNREGIMSRLTFTEEAPKRWRVTKMEAIPTWVDLDPDIRLIELSRALADPKVPEDRRRTYQAALDRIRGHLLSRGAGPAHLVIASRRVR
jgi:Bacterial capsule synthesis protein PGA_cap